MTMISWREGRFYCVVILLCVIGFTQSFNIDVTEPKIMTGPPGSYFGYTVDFVEKDGRKWILAGAPQDTDGIVSEKTGALYRCSPARTGTCDQLNIVSKAGSPPGAQDREDMWLGASLDVGDSVATCAPRWKKNISADVMYMNGICYEIPLAYLNGDPFIRPAVLPVLAETRFNSMQINDSPDLDNFNRSWVYGLSTVGLSVKFDSQLKEDLLIGGPGVNEFAGSLVRLKQIEVMVYPQENTAEYLSEMYGYAIATGKFYDNGQTYRAIGGPRDGVTGKVLLLNEAYGEADRLSGMETGSYFGSTLCATRINDGTDQERLLVGAPFYSNLTMSADFYNSKIEQGIVYVYSYNSAEGRLTVLQDLTGSEQQSARFGSAMAAIGDINKDSYYDVAIGAPFENDGEGAVYIYNGYINGFWKTQVMNARTVDTRLRAFGSAFSQNPLDINGDSYADLLVGAYESGHAVRLFTKPPITMKVEVKTSLTNDVIKDSISSFTVSACFDYQGENLPTNVDLDYSITADSEYANGNGKKPRVCILSGNDCVQTSAIQRETIFLAPPSVSCGTAFNVTVLDKNVDLFTPVVFSVTYKIQDTVTTDCVDVCPVINLFNPTVEDPFTEAFQKQTEFELPGCGDDNVCQTDLYLMVDNFKFGYGGTDVLILGKQASLMFDITLTNNAEPAYNTRLVFQYPDVISYVQENQLPAGNVEMSCFPSFLGMITQLECDTNPAELGVIKTSTINFQVTLDARYLKSSMGSFELQIQAVSQSEDKNLMNNVFTKMIQVKSEVNTNIAGVPNPEFYVTKETPDMKPVDVYHSVTILNQGPSPLSVPSTLTIKYPRGFIGGQAVVTVESMIMNISSADSTTNVSCSIPTSVVPDSLNSEYRAFQLTLPVVTITGDSMNFDCSKENCDEVTCTLNSIPADTFVAVVVNYKVDSVLYNKVQSKTSGTLKSVPLVTQMALSLPKEYDNILFDVPSSISVSTEVLPSAPIAEEVKPWIIVVCIIAALVIVAILVFVMWKFGFFKRKQKEELEKKKEESGKPLVEQVAKDEEDGAEFMNDGMEEAMINNEMPADKQEKVTIPEVEMNSSLMEEHAPEKMAAQPLPEKTPIQVSGENDETNWGDVDKMVSGFHDYDTVKDSEDSASPEEVKVETKSPEEASESENKDIPKEATDDSEAPEPDYAKIDKSKKA